MTNIANLKPEPFAAIAAGRKSTEWRWRNRIDSRLEAVERDEPVILLEIGSDRCICATISAIMRFDYPSGYLYAFRLGSPRISTAPGVRKVQGWTRRASL